MEIIIESRVTPENIVKTKREAQDEVANALNMCNDLEMVATKLAKEYRIKFGNVKSDINDVRWSVKPGDESTDSQLEAYDTLNILQGDLEELLEDFKDKLNDLPDNVYLA